MSKMPGHSSHDFKKPEGVTRVQVREAPNSQQPDSNATRRRMDRGHHSKSGKSNLKEEPAESKDGNAEIMARVCTSH